MVIVIVVESNCAFPLTNVFTPNLFFLALRFNEPFSSLVPPLSDTFPLIPWTSFFFIIIFIMPPVPSASYLAPGLVTTSILCIWLAGMVCKTSAILFPNIVDGFPLIKKRIPELPCSSTLPFTSTETCGTFFMSTLS